ncbi:alpha,alpha-trehalase TreF [Ravibacter arvi]|uniref:Alpha,alpha-trehalase TreF n=1 Tax=Ravibacter arvi TaxID=2051041 RepID=A0ABP8M1Q4_9BACT
MLSTPVISHKTDFLQEFGVLFRDVQMSGIFSDSITFNDCIPKHSPAEILAKYNTEQEEADFDLADFVLENFDFPDFKPQHYESRLDRPIADHIELLWEILTREHLAESGSSLIPLPNPYIVPGGRFRGLYYWDSYFNMLGLEESGKIDLIESMLENFSFLIGELGFIPNANRTYYLGRSQPPVFVLMIEILSHHKGPQTWDRYLPYLEKEYLFWMNGHELLSEENPAANRVVRLPDGTLLNRYWDNSDAPRPESYREDVEVGRLSERSSREVYRHIRAAAESGWDFSSRWFKNGMRMEHIHTTDILPIDLNCLLCHTEKVLIAHYADLPHKRELVETLSQRMSARETAIRTLFWEKQAGFFVDYDWIEGKRRDVLTLAALYPLFFSLASAQQAKKTAAKLEALFLKPGGFVTTLHESGQQWDLPNGWAPLHWITVSGLSRYGFDELARTGCERWLRGNYLVYKKTGKMTEKYNMLDRLEDAQGGEYPNQDGFGWTNGVFLKLSRFIREGTLSSQPRRW